MAVLTAVSTVGSKAVMRAAWRDESKVEEKGARMAAETADE